MPAGSKSTCTAQRPLHKQTRERAKLNWLRTGHTSSSKVPLEAPKPLSSFGFEPGGALCSPGKDGGRGKRQSWHCGARAPLSAALRTSSAAAKQAEEPFVVRDEVVLVGRERAAAGHGSRSTGKKANPKAAVTRPLCDTLGFLE